MEKNVKYTFTVKIYFISLIGRLIKKPHRGHDLFLATNG